MTLSALRPGALVLGIAVLGLALSTAAHLWWWRDVYIAFVTVGGIGTIVMLAVLYDTERRPRFGKAPLVPGIAAVLVLYGLGVGASQDIAMALVGVDADAVVARAWTTPGKHSRVRHCTLRHIDGTPIPHEYRSGYISRSCWGPRTGETIPVVLDPKGRFPPVRGPKSDMPVVGVTQVLTIAGLVFLASIALGCLPAREE